LHAHRGTAIRLKLTAKTVAVLTLPAGKDEEIYWDTGLPGFGYRLRRRRGDGTVRTWIAQYKRGGRTRKITLGSAPPVGAEAARKAAEKNLAKVKLGEDPQAERRDRAAKDRNTMRALVDDYLAAKKPRLRSATFTEITRYLTGGYFKTLHNMPVDSIRRGDVSDRVAVIERENGSATGARGADSVERFFRLVFDHGAYQHRRKPSRQLISTGRSQAARARVERCRASRHLERLRRRNGIRQDRQAFDLDRLPSARSRGPALVGDRPRGWHVDDSGDENQKR